MHVAPRLLALLLGLGIAGAACGKADPTASPIRVGEPKEALLDRLGVPTRNVIAKNGKLTTMTYASDPMARWREQQPADEVWLWTYKDDAVYTIRDGKVWATPATNAEKLRDAKK